MLLVCLLQLRNTCFIYSPQHIVQMAIEENVDAIGISFLEGEHFFYTDKLIKELRQNDIRGAKVFIGGVIPPEDVKELKALGVDAVFTPGTPKQKILDVIGSLGSLSWEE